MLPGVDIMTLNWVVFSSDGGSPGKEHDIKQFPPSEDSGGKWPHRSGLASPLDLSHVRDWGEPTACLLISLSLSFFLSFLSLRLPQHSVYEDAGLIPGLAWWAKDLALLQAVA